MIRQKALLVRTSLNLDTHSTVILLNRIIALNLHVRKARAGRENTS